MLMLACSPAVPAQDVSVEYFRLEVIDSFPHDPGAFTQGLIFVDGELLESTGLYGRSSLRRVDPYSGTILQQLPLDANYFGEGVAQVGDRLVVLTWKSGIALVFDKETFELVDQWGFNGQGWGLAYDGERFVMSNGSSRLTYRSAEDFRWLETVDVTLNGKSVERINELEFVNGKLYGNLWGEERIVRIDPKTGVVDGVIDASGLLSPAESRMVDVLNGIAYDAETETFWLTGKFWPRMFQVRLVPR